METQGPGFGVLLKAFERGGVGEPLLEKAFVRLTLISSKVAKHRQEIGSDPKRKVLNVKLLFKGRSHSSFVLRQFPSQTWFCSNPATHVQLQS